MHHNFQKIIFTPIKFMWYMINFVREFTLNIFLLCLIIAIITFLLQIRNSFVTPDKYALLIDLNGIIVDSPDTSNQGFRFYREIFKFSDFKLKENSLFEIINKIRAAKYDSHVTGIVLFLKNFTGADQPSLQYIGKTLQEFRNTGKPIYSIGDNYNQAQYFLASYANKIYLTSNGSVDLYGIVKNNFYYRSFLDKLKINRHVFRIGACKSAVDPFLRDSISECSRRDSIRWIKQIWKNYLMDISHNRKIPIHQLLIDIREISKSLELENGDFAKLALHKRWIDKISSNVEMESIMIKLFGWNKSSHTYNNVSIYNYHPIIRQNHGKEISVIFVNGILAEGKKATDPEGIDSIVSQIRDSRLNPNVKGIILRVNSPGGSVNASEMIRSELSYFRDSGKPVVVSMGSVAASGGYWISTPANYIIAHESTLTGSIGIFGIIHTMERSLDYIGIHYDGVSTSPLADVSMAKDIPHEFAKIFQISVENEYKKFIDLVSKSRCITLKEVNRIAQGHVWVGIDALKNKLVDQLGDFDHAVKKIIELTNLKEYQLKWYPRHYGLVDLLFQGKITVSYFIGKLIESFIYIPTIRNIDKLRTDFEILFDQYHVKNCYAFCFTCGYTL